MEGCVRIQQTHESRSKTIMKTVPSCHEDAGPFFNYFSTVILSLEICFFANYTTKVALILGHFKGDQSEVRTKCSFLTAVLFQHF